MGEMADDMIEGACCSQCGVYFEEENGFPALCKSCWRRVPKTQIEHHVILGVSMPMDSLTGLQPSQHPTL